jgi:hypothetical protein
MTNQIGPNDIEKITKYYDGKIRSLRRAGYLGIGGMILLLGMWGNTIYQDTKKIDQQKEKISQLEKDSLKCFEFQKVTDVPEPLDASISYTSYVEIGNKEKGYIIMPIEINDRCWCKKKETPYTDKK